VDGLLDLQPGAQEHVRSLRVAVYASGGAPAHHLALVALWGGQPNVIHAEGIANGTLTDYDAVIFPGGGLRAMTGQLEPLGKRGAEALRRWVAAGGTYLGSCAGSCHPLRMSEPYLAANPIAGHLEMCDVTPVNAAAGAWGLDSPGTGRIRVAADDSPLFAGFTEPFEIVHYNGPLFPNVPGAAGQVLGEGAWFTPFERSLGSTARPTTLERAALQEARMAYHQSVGSGQVILFGSHPEFGASVLGLGWLSAARLLENALSFVPARGAVQPTFSTLGGESLRAMNQTVEALREVLEQVHPLGQHLPDTAPPFLGYTGRDLWHAALTETRGVLALLQGWLKECPTGEGLVSPFLMDAAPRETQDYGFMGVRQLLDRALEMAQQAAALPPHAWPAFTGAYDEFLTHPYHLLASTYLSVGGLIASAGLQTTAFAAVNGLPDPEVIPLTA